MRSGCTEFGHVGIGACCIGEVFMIFAAVIGHGRSAGAAPEGAAPRDQAPAGAEAVRQPHMQQAAARRLPRRSDHLQPDLSAGALSPPASQEEAGQIRCVLSFEPALIGNSKRPRLVRSVAWTILGISRMSRATVSSTGYLHHEPARKK
jgi:hypothetical protein